jgi:hypothetical protein
MSATFHYTCECGYALPIAASSAGTSIPCRCGKQVKVPKLSELKRLSGQQVEPIIGIADQLRTMYLDKQLPPDTHCIFCQVKTTDRLECWVECERAHARGPSWLTTTAAFLISPMLYCLMVKKDYDNPSIEGRDVMVRVPLPICQNCLPTTPRSEGNIRKLLQSVVVYRKLLEAYPGARVGAS